MPALRKWVLGLTLAASVVASFVEGPWWSTESDSLGAPRTSAGSAQARRDVARSAADATASPLAIRQSYGPAAANLFATRNWQPAPALPARQSAAPPVAPPLPFRYLGKMLDGDEVVAFLAQDTRTLLLRRGDVVANYKVVDITEQQMTLVYVPLNQTQQLPFGSAN